MSELNGNSVDPDQMPHYGASDLGYTVCRCPFYGMLDLNGLNLHFKENISKNGLFFAFV